MNPQPVEALVVVDAQTGLLEGAAAVPDAARVRDRLVTLLAAARGAHALVIHLQNDGAPGSADAVDTPGWFIHPDAAPGGGEAVLRKSGDDGFDGTGLAVVLAAGATKRLAIAGLLSEMCVSATARSALARGLDVVLVRDAHATYDLDDIPSHVVARVAEHALGDRIELADAADVQFVSAGSARNRPC